MTAVRPASRTLTMPSGAKVRTRKSTRYVAVETKPTWEKAHVLFGSNSLGTLKVRLRRSAHRRPSDVAVVIFDMVDGRIVG